MQVGVQFRGTIAASGSRRWLTHSWPASWHVVWTVVPTSLGEGGPQIEWEVTLERTSRGQITYFLTIKNLTSQPVDIEARYAILNQ